MSGAIPHAQTGLLPMPERGGAFMPYPPQTVPHAPDGALSGLSFAVKDIFHVAGYPTSAGSPFVLALSGPQARTAWAVEQLLNEGARFVGKVVSDEFAFSMSGRNAHFGAPLNAAAPDRITGGSSSGSAAAVAAGHCDFALGSDTGGSIRAPASHCGLYGIRPTQDRVSLDGAHALAPSFDTCGWMAREAVVLERVGETLLGRDQLTLPRRPRLIWPRDVWDLLQPETRAALEPMARRIASGFDGGHEASVSGGDWDSLYWSFRHLQGREAWQVNGALLQRYQPPLGPDVAARFAWCAQVTDGQVSIAQRSRERLRERMRALLEEDGVLLLPTMPDCAPLRSATESSLETYRETALRMTCIAGLAGLPQVTMPLGRSGQAPLGLSLMGPAHSDRSLLRTVSALVHEVG